MRHPLLRGLCRLMGFFAGLLIFLCLCNTYFIKTDTYSRMALHEMQTSSDIELAFVGSSVVRDHFNTARISQAIGLKCFAAAVPNASLQSDLAITEELYRTNSPEWIVLVVEPFTFETVREGLEAECSLMPYLSSPQNRLSYLMRLGREDGLWLDRLLLFRQYGADSPADVLKTIALRHFPEQTFDMLRAKGRLPKDITYQRGGFVRYDCAPNTHLDQTEDFIRQDTGYTYALYDHSKEMLLAYRDLCVGHGSKLMVLIYPNMTAHNLADPSMLGYKKSLMRFCSENGIACVNFTRAKRTLCPVMDEQYFDIYHMTGKGADALSDGFAHYFTRYTAGEEVSSLFYDSDEEYLASIDFVTNVWLDALTPGSWNSAWAQRQTDMILAAQNRDVYLANSNHGTQVTPMYRFVLVNADGSETLLRDYSACSYYACAPGALAGCTLRVYARANTHPNQSVYGDLLCGSAAR